MEHYNIWELLQQNDDQEIDFVIVAPYMETKFYNWLKDSYGIKSKNYQQEYINNYMSAYERIYNEIHVNAYKAFMVLFKHGNDLADFALDIFQIAYVDTMEEMIQEDQHAFTPMEYRSITAYRDFLMCLAGQTPDSICNMNIPHEEEFKTWLESINMGLENITKVVSSIHRSISWYKHTPLYKQYNNPFLTASTLKLQEEREKLFNSLKSQSQNITHNITLKPKTIQNNISNLRLFFNFLNNQLK